MKKGYKNVTMQHIADALKISKNAVSLALSNKLGVSEELRNQILKTADEMGYKHISKNSNNLKKDILVLVPEYIKDDKYFYYDIYWEVERYANKKGFQVINVVVSKEDEKQMNLISNANEEYEGVIAIGVFNRDYAKKMVKNINNIVFVDNYYYGLEAQYILTANIDAVVEIVNYLIRMGHKDIGFIGAINATSSLSDRWMGYLKGMKLNNLEIDMEKCITPYSELNSLLNNIDEIQVFIEELKSKGKMPTAWISGNDRVAYSLINVLTKLGYDVPKDVSVMGFDDIEFSKLFNPPLTTVKVPRTILAREAIRVLLKKSLSEKIVKKREYYTKIIERHSVSKLE